jgi:hypothetical protein
MALGLPDEFIYSEMGLDPALITEMKTKQANTNTPYPNPLRIGPDGTTPAAGGVTRVSVTPGNAPKGESATAISNTGGNGGRGRG